METLLQNLLLGGLAVAGGGARHGAGGGVADGLRLELLVARGDAEELAVLAAEGALAAHGAALVLEAVLGGLLGVLGAGGLVELVLLGALGGLGHEELVSRVSQSQGHDAAQKLGAVAGAGAGPLGHHVGVAALALAGGGDLVGVAACGGGGGGLEAAADLGAGNEACVGEHLATLLRLPDFLTACLLRALPRRFLSSSSLAFWFRFCCCGFADPSKALFAAAKVLAPRTA